MDTTMVRKHNKEIKSAYRASYAIAMRGNLHWIVPLFTLPQKIQFHYCSVIAFAKQTQKIIFSNLTNKEKLDLLWQYNNDLSSIADNMQTNTKSSTILALASTINGYNLSVTPFLQRVQAFITDVEQESYYDFQELLTFCQVAAEGIFKSILHISSIKDPLVTVSMDYLATATQLVAILKYECLKLQRILLPNSKTYLPLCDLSNLNIPIQDISKLSYKKNIAELQPLIQIQLNRLQSITKQGEALPENIGSNMQRIAKHILYSIQRQIAALDKTIEKFTEKTIY